MKIKKSHYASVQACGMPHSDFGKRGGETVTESILCDSAYARKARWTMNLREVREWAAMGHDYVQSPVLQNVMQHILATIDTEPDAAITADWLREVWGFEYVGEMDKDKMYLDHDYSHYMVVMHERVVLFHLDCDYGNTWPHDLHTRQQFCDLARCLGIPRKDGAK